MPETITFGVFQHSSGPMAGYVVRPMYDGWCPAPYSSAVRWAEYASEEEAEAIAAQLNRANRAPIERRHHA